MNICMKDQKQSVRMDEGNRFKYSVRTALGKLNYFVGTRNEDGRVGREMVSEADFKNIECRLVDNR